MDNLYKKIESELSSFSAKERKEILGKLRVEVDSIDKQLVSLLSKRTLHSVLIGRIKRSLNLATYDPNREKEIIKRISTFVEEPLTPEALTRIYERIIDESRAIQRAEKEKGNVFNTSARKMKVGFKNFLSKKQFFIVGFFFIALLALFYYTFFTSNYYEQNSPAKFEIKRGEPLGSIADRLENEKIIPSSTNFKLAAYLYGAEKNIRAARFFIPNGLSYLDLVEYFISGEADYLKEVKIYNGMSYQWIASKLQLDTFIDSSAVANLCTDREFIDSLGIDALTLEGYLLPQKYDIYERSAPKEAIGIIYDGFKIFMADSIMQEISQTKYELNEILTLASIVQGETNKIEEMPTIAGVYLNRLRIGMKLQADPTVQYLQDGGWKRLTYQDLKIDNPYNTYKFFGLPPGPINNPGKNAILAAVYPEDHDYLFFVADGTGGHKFAENYTQHLRYVREYREWLNSQKKD